MNMIVSITQTSVARLLSTPVIGVRWVSMVTYGQPTPKCHPHLMKEGEVTPGTPLSEYKRRQLSLMSLLPEHSLAIIPAHSLLLMSADIPYPFRQNSDFSYLCGFEEPDALLLLKSTTKDRAPRSVMVVSPQDRNAMLWNGPRSGVDGAISFFGADEAYPLSKTKDVLINMLQSQPRVYYNNTTQNEVVTPAIKAVLGETHNTFIPLERYTSGMRVIKSQYEMDIMRRVGKISGAAMIEAMKATKPGQTEHQLQNILEYSVRTKGCQRLAYPPVVASGIGALTLHYIANDQVIRNGDLVLIDAGGELNNYASDITRTWPSNGKFSEPQAEIYEAVLKTNKECIKVCKANGDISLDGLYRLSIFLLVNELRSLKVIPSRCTESEASRGGWLGMRIQLVSRWYPHHVSHYLGMDTHDTGDVSRQQALRSGMVITVEPGLYFQLDDPLAPERYRGIGVRIEDDIHITEGEPEVLTIECPKEISEVESVMANTSSLD